MGTARAWKGWCFARFGTLAQGSPISHFDRSIQPAHESRAGAKEKRPDVAEISEAGR